MRLLLLVVVIAAVAGAEPAAARDVSLSPQTVVRRFVAAVNAPVGERSPCRWLSVRLRTPLGLPALIGLDPRFPDSYRTAEAVRACDVFVAYGKTFDNGRLRSTRLLSLRRVARAGGRLLLRGVIERRFVRPAQVRRGRVDDFLLREHGEWRIVSPARLWQLGFDDGVPHSFAGLRRHLRWLARVEARRAAEQHRLVRGYLATRVPIAPVLVPLAGARSEVRDRLGDVVRFSGKSGRTAGEGGADRGEADAGRAARVDLSTAALVSSGETVTIELRFGAAVPDDARIDLWTRQGREMFWTATVHHGWVSAFAGEISEPRPVRGVEAAARGDTLLLRFAVRSLRAAVGPDRAVRLDGPFHWSVAVSEAVPTRRAPLARQYDLAPDESDPAPGGLTRRSFGALAQTGRPRFAAAFKAAIRFR